MDEIKKYADDNKIIVDWLIYFICQVQTQRKDYNDGMAGTERHVLSMTSIIIKKVKQQMVDSNTVFFLF